MFLPAAGLCYYGSVGSQGDYGFYWSSTASGNNYLVFSSGFMLVDECYRDYGCSVRAVLNESAE